MTGRIYKPPYRYEVSAHGPATVWDAQDTGWVCRIKESLPHKEEIAKTITAALNRAAREEELAAPTGDPVIDGMRAYIEDKSPG